MKGHEARVPENSCLRLTIDKPLIHRVTPRGEPQFRYLCGDNDHNFKEFVGFSSKHAQKLDNYRGLGRNVIFDASPLEEDLEINERETQSVH